MNKLLVSLIYLLIFLSPLVFGEVDTDAKYLIEQATKEKLHQHPTWQRLLHLEKNVLGKDKSQIIEDDFFLSPVGRYNPQLELQETLNAFFRTDVTGNRHPQCQYPARLMWLQKQLDWSEVSLPEVVCDEFDSWTFRGDVDSLSLLFVTGYFKNPASYYGHLLLKFNLKGETQLSDLLDQTLNYGALLPDDYNMMSYVLNGLFGGYKAAYSHQKFYKYNHHYAEEQLRDIWEYKLDLSKEDVDFIVAHAWELKRARFKYYFFKKNCAYHMAELIELVIEEPLVHDRAPWTIPYTVFDQLSAYEHNGHPLVKEVSYMPSLRKRFTKHYNALEAPLQQLTKTSVLQNRFPPDTYATLELSQKVAITDTLLEYYNFREITDKHNPTLKSRKQDLLIERLRLNQKSRPIAYQDSLPPHYSQKPSMLQFSLLSNSGFGNGLQLGFRPAYNDYLTHKEGQQQYAVLLMGDLKVRYADNTLWVHRLEFIRVETLNLSTTGLPGDGGLAWRFHTGIESQDLACIGCQNVYLGFGVGKGKAISDSAAIFTMVETKVQSDPLGQGALAVKPTVGLIKEITPTWKTYFYGGTQHHTQKGTSPEPILSWENKFGSSRSKEMRLKYAYHNESEITLSAGFFW